MTLELAVVILAVAATIIGLMMWAINTAEQRIRTIVRAGLERPDDGHTAALIRSRALDHEYRQLVLDAHNADE